MWATTIWQGGICVADCYGHAFEMFASGIAIVMALLTRRWIYLPVAFGIGALLFLVAMAASGPGAPIEFLQSKLLNPVDTFAAYEWAFAPLAATLLLVFAVKRVLIWAVTGDAAIGLRLLVGVPVLVLSGIALFLVTYLNAPTLLPRRVVERAAETLGDAPARCRPESARMIADLPIYRGHIELPPRAIPPLSSADRALPEVYTTQMGTIERQLTRVEAIRVADVSRYKEVRQIAVSIVIDEQGDVVAASPYAGPSDLYARAVEIASRWKFVPFIRDGRPTRVRLNRIAIPIEGPEQWLSQPIPFPVISDFASTVIKLKQLDSERGLSLEIRGDGSVTFVGEGDLVALHGRHCALVARETIDALIVELRKSNFLSMLAEYEDDGRVAYDVTVALDDDVKQVRIARGSGHAAPKQLWRLIDAVLESVSADRWVMGNRLTVPSLIAEGWSGARHTDDDLWMLAGVAQMGDVETIKELIALGAPVQTKPYENAGMSFPYLLDHQTALERAARRGAFDIVRVLLAAPVQWSPETIGSAYVSALSFGDLRMADELLARGADPAAARGYGNRTPLMAAAESGLPDAVDRALKIAGDVNEKDDDKFAALHWAAGADYLKVVDSVRANRPRVIEMLLRAGAGINQRGYRDWTPLISNWMGFPEVAAAFIAHGADVNAQDEDGRTPLMANSSVEAVRLLLKAGADPYLRNREGQNALEVAQADVFAQGIVPVLGQWMATHPPHTVRH